MHAATDLAVGTVRFQRRDQEVESLFDACLKESIRTDSVLRPTRTDVMSDGVVGNGAFRLLYLQSE